MGKIVSDLMLLAEIDGTLSNTADGTAQVDDVLKAIVTQYQPKCHAKGIVIELIRCQELRVLVSKESLQRIVSNLIENAWRYTDSGGKIRLSAEQLNAFGKIVVEDTGIGIPAESLPLIFDRFYRVDKSRSRASGGSGLGLSIVKALVDSHRGLIQVTSKLGQGTVVSVLLHIAPNT
jgi:signal transduction histidine kinase